MTSGSNRRTVSADRTGHSTRATPPKLIPPAFTLGVSDGQLNGTPEMRFSLVGREVKKCGLEDTLASGLVVTGGSTILEGLPELAEEVLSMPVRRGVPKGVGGLFEVQEDPPPVARRPQQPLDVLRCNAPRGGVVGDGR